MERADPRGRTEGGIDRYWAQNRKLLKDALSRAEITSPHRLIPQAAALLVKGAGPGLAIDRPLELSAMARIRVGLAGCGFVSELHMYAYKRVYGLDVEVRAVAAR